MIKFILKKYWLIFSLVLLEYSQVNSQSYSLTPVDLNSQASPGDFFYSSLRVANISSAPIEIFFTRIVKDLPPNWTSCFCYPTCIAPFIDTLTFTIAPFSEDSIKPNYQSDFIPGIGTIVITLYQVGFESQIDTITFTGSTLDPSGINETNHKDISIYPNPANDILFLSGMKKNDIHIKAFNAQGKLCLFEKSRTGLDQISVAGLPSGIYLFAMDVGSFNRVYKKILIQH